MRFTLHPLWTSGYFNPPAQTYFPDQFGYYLFSHIDFTQLFPISTTYNYPPPPHLYPHLSSLLNKYQSLSFSLMSLQPPCPTDHHIHNLPNSSLINACPYCYPHFQKCDIEKQIDELLHMGLIQLSHYLFPLQFYL